MTGRQMQREFRGFGLSQNQIAGAIGISAPVPSTIFTEKVEARKDTQKIEPD
jgi:hypothetical protein